MANRTLHLFPDTNIFIQCKPLHEVDWTLLGDFDEIVLLICRPIQDEIDQQKGRGAGRVTDRARATSGTFRGMLKTQTDKIERDAAPQVRLRMMLMLKPTPSLGDLDYGNTDDALVGCAHAFAKQNSEMDVRVLTDDGGPMGSANAVGVRFVDVPGAWLLPPEPSPLEKKLAQQEAENARLRKTEPEIEIVCRDESGAELSVIEVEHLVFLPLTDAQVAALLQKLKDDHPMETEFGLSEPKTRSSAGLVNALFQEEWRPPKPEDVEDYRDKRYPEWLEKCDTDLRRLHSKLRTRETPRCVVFEARNDGSRPATQVRIDVGTEGHVMVKPPPYKDDAATATDVEIALPRPPAAPHGQWVRTRLPATTALDLTNRLLRDLDPLGIHGFNSRGLFTQANAFAVPLSPRIADLTPPRPDREGFYYEGGRPHWPCGSFALTCDLWRHSREAKRFDVELHVMSGQPGKTGGRITVTVHAGNLTTPAEIALPVKIAVSEVEVYATAETLVEKLRPVLKLRPGVRGAD